MEGWQTSRMHDCASFHLPKQAIAVADREADGRRATRNRTKLNAFHLIQGGDEPGDPTAVLDALTHSR